MDLNEIVNVLGNGFFPIAACAFMFYQNNKLSNTLAQLSTTLSGINQRLDNIEDKLEDK